MLNATRYQAVVRTGGGMFLKASTPRATVAEAKRDAVKLSGWKARKATDVIDIERTDGRALTAEEA